MRWAGALCRSDAPEVEFMNLTVTVYGDRAMDALTSGRVLSLHEDTFDVPQRAIVTATSKRFVHGFRFGSSLAVQSHPEVTPEILLEWIKDPAVGRIAAQAGVDPDRLATEVGSARGELEATAIAFFGAWFDEVDEHIARTSAD